jgi:hypothetical protein
MNTRIILFLMLAGAVTACGTDDGTAGPTIDVDAATDVAGDGTVGSGDADSGPDATDSQDTVDLPDSGDAGADAGADADAADAADSGDAQDATDPTDAGDGSGTGDTDGPDVADECPDDESKTEPGICGCGVPDAGDTDDDGELDCVDTDDDGDGVLDGDDASPLVDTECSDADFDGCDDCSIGTFDVSDDGADIDGDGVCDARAGATYTFTTCGKTGGTGPDAAYCESAYAGTLLEDEVTLDSGFQLWTVPETGIYRVRAIGASGGGMTSANPGGLGAVVEGTFSFDAGDQLLVVAGQAGTDRTGCEDYGGGGGGGTYVMEVGDSGRTILLPEENYQVEPLLVAGGGAGANDDNWGCEPGDQDRTLQHATFDEPGDGSGGTGSSLGGQGGGGGYASNGTDESTDGGRAVTSGARASLDLIEGGFGGGSDGYDGGGCGGGYTGGSAYDPDEGYCSGGSSFNTGDDPSGALAVERGDGRVVVYRIGALDSDGDGVADWNDPAPLDATVCGDMDADTCDDCSVTGIAGSVDNDGPDSDGNGVCDAGEASSAWTFTTCDATGPEGPGQDDCVTAYTGTALDAAVTVESGYQRWVVPTTGRYRISTSGAQGGSTNVTEMGGAGARISSIFELQAGDELILVVGQMGTSKDDCSDYGGGGGGGTYVTMIDEAGSRVEPLDLAVTPLVVAGGGGGASDEDSACEGQESDAYAGRGLWVGDGQGGTAAVADGGAGGGFFSGGEDGDSTGGDGFLQGAQGGVDANYPGGFGGGADSYDSGGSGGGYTGGSTSGYLGRGGYSYAAGSAVVAADGVNEGPGSVVVELLNEP